ncbi:helix-turn-helix domain-containing protein [Nitratireductor soli]|uniref:helix-turn-helix domain-containing protein n=1 Tax=Nitratireductor soli TaxID=1670619 RepID=UPI00065E7596|nr:helix-turn-helix transcriptional regulator [Nitratireductor soli]
MARKDRTHIVNDAVKNGDSKTVKYLTKEEFGRRIYNMMLEKGWRQSDLARRSGLTKDSVSTYVRGKAFPTPASVAKLASAFGAPAEEIFPNHVHNAIVEDTPDFELKVSPGDTTKAWLRINRQVRFDTAAKIAEMLAEDAANRD